MRQPRGPVFVHESGFRFRNIAALDAAVHSHKSCSLLDCFVFSIWDSLPGADSAQALPGLKFNTLSPVNQEM
jgi:hypothetical protein